MTRRAGREIIKAMTRVLIVDDDPVIRVVVGALFRDEGYAVDTAAHGVQALHQVRAAPPDAIVLDLLMPVMDGASFLDACHEQGLCADTPVIVFSAKRWLVGSTLRGLKHKGVRAVLTKPSDVVALTAVVARYAPVAV
jgi:CheY-like chemotaxis protein